MEDVAAEMRRLLVEPMDEPGRAPTSGIFVPSLILCASA